MTLLDALRAITENIKIWAESKFLKANDASTLIAQEVLNALPEQNELILSGAVNCTYDGSSKVEVTIPTSPSKTSELTNDSGYITSVPVQSVNGKTGKVNITAEDIGALQSYTETDPTVPSWAKSSTKPTYTKDEVGLGNVDNVKQYSADNPPPYPVTSVNGQTGAITIGTLPAVTTSDNGKVLMVVDGAWKVVDLNMSIDTNGIVSV